jgi:hypothetical protein
LPSAETRTEALKMIQTPADMKDNPVVKYLRLKALKQRANSSDKKKDKSLSAKESSNEKKSSSTKGLKVNKLLKVCYLSIMSPSTYILSFYPIIAEIGRIII